LVRRNYRTSDAVEILRRRYKPLVSIIIPTRNRWDILEKRAISSILNQTYKHWELVIIDDGSNKGGFSYFYDNKWFPPRINLWRTKKKFHYPKNAWCRWAAGPVKALNFALSKVKGDYILRMDDDDELVPSALETLLDYIKGTRIEFVSAEYVATRHTIDNKFHRIPAPCIIRGKKIGGIQTTLMRSYLKCFRYDKDCWRKKWNSLNDLDLVDRMIKAGVKVAYLPKVVCQIRPRPNQTEIGWKAQQKEYKDNV